MARGIDHRNSVTYGMGGDFIVDDRIHYGFALGALALGLALGYVVKSAMTPKDDKKASVEAPTA